MPSGNYQISANIEGHSYAQTVTVTSDNAVISEKNVSGGAAPSGTLTTRTDNVTGTLTMASGSHGITTSSRLDIYWDAGTGMGSGCAYGATVGTVSGTSVPFATANGDILPAATTAIIAKVPETESVVVTGNNVTGIGVSTTYAGTIIVAAGATNTMVKRFTTAGAYNWNSTTGGTNPLAGASITQIWMSHASTAASSMSAALQYN